MHCKLYTTVEYYFSQFFIAIMLHDAQYYDVKKTSSKLTTLSLSSHEEFKHP